MLTVVGFGRGLIGFATIAARVLVMIVVGFVLESPRRSKFHESVPLNASWSRVTPVGVTEVLLFVRVILLSWRAHSMKPPFRRSPLNAEV